MKIALYSGSFNPVHVGHVALARYLIDNNIVDMVLMSVTPLNPLKQHQQMAPNEVRLKLLQLAVEGIDRVEACDVEFNLPQPNYTVNTLHFLSTQCPNDKFCLLIGADNAALFNRWYQYQEILDNYDVLVYPREGYELPIAEFPQFKYINAPIYNVSSTEIREKLANNEPITHLVDEKVEHYLRSSNFFR